MNAEQIALIKQSWATMRPKSARMAATFYEELFKRDNSLRDLFKGEMHEQAQRLANMLDMVVNALDNIDEVRPMVESIGVRHIGYGVQEDDYGIFGETLLATIQAEMGANYTPDIEAAWQAAYQMLAGIMTKAATEQGVAGAAN